MARLERLTQTLVERYRGLREEREALRGELDEREERIRSLEARLAELGQGRQEAAKRLDQLLERIDRLDGRLVPAAPPGAASARE